MSVVRAELSISLDGFGAGPNQGPEHPLGEGGMRLHEWAIATESWRRQHGEEGGVTGPDSEIAERMMDGVGAFVMGRGMFGGGDGPWDESWRGWWGDEPPYHAPVFVLTHHPRKPVEMQGGTTFHFATDGVESALEQARSAAGDDDVLIAGGPGTVNQFLAAGLLDEMQLHIVPIVLGDGERLLEEVGDPTLEPVDVVGTPAATHVLYRVAR